MRSVPRHGCIDLTCPGIDPAIEVDGIAEARVSKKLDNDWAANAMMTHDDDGLVLGHVVDPRRDAAHRNVQGARDVADLELGRFAHIENPVRQSRAAHLGDLRTRDRLFHGVAARFGTYRASHSAARLPTITIGSRSINSREELWPMPFNTPPSFGPTIEPIRPTATAAPTPMPRMAVGYGAGAMA